MCPRSESRKQSGTFWRCAATMTTTTTVTTNIKSIIFFGLIVSNAIMSAYETNFYRKEWKIIQFNWFHLTTHNRFFSDIHSMKLVRQVINSLTCISLANESSRCRRSSSSNSIIVKTRPSIDTFSLEANRKHEH